MQLSLLDSDLPDGGQVDLEYRHDHLELPVPGQAANPPLLAGMSVDLLRKGEAKCIYRAQVNLQTGALHLIGEGGSWQVADSRAADELRLSLYSRLTHSWREDYAPTELIPEAETLLMRIESEVERIAGQDLLDQAPGMSKVTDQE